MESLDKPEIVFGLVAPIGVDLDIVQEQIISVMEEFNYKTHVHRISSFFSETPFQSITLKIKKKPKSNFDKMLQKMEIGNLIREKTKINNFLAAYGISKIHSLRNNSGGNLQGNAQIFRSLKHPDEAKLLKKVYGVGYFQIGIYASENDRIAYLMSKSGLKKSEASALIEKDISENIKHGQKTRDAFQLSDFFVNFDSKNPELLKEEITRFLDLIFGNPHITPTLEEQAMYMAFAYSFRSADLSRQVGASIVSSNNEIIALGSNDVPKFGGGTYWPGVDDRRDYKLGVDPNEKLKNEIVLKVMKAFCKENDEKKLLEMAEEKLKETGLFDITEYGRAVHAEMSAILSATRSGVSTQNGTIFCTTFPCHNCAKHIISAGLKRVVFVEPYPKSQALNLHNDAICLDEMGKNKLVFEPFFGVSATRYIDLFSMRLGQGHEITRKIKGLGRAEKFTRSKAKARVPMVATSYIDSEKYAISKLAVLLKQKDNKEKGFKNGSKKTKKKTK